MTNVLNLTHPTQQGFVSMLANVIKIGSSHDYIAHGSCDRGPGTRVPLSILSPATPAV